MKHLDPTKWVSWDETGYGAPETEHAPVVHQMSHTVFNGILNVFIYGNDGYLHHIWQTTSVTRFQTLGGGAHGVFGTRLATRFLQQTLLIVL